MADSKFKRYLKKLIKEHLPKGLRRFFLAWAIDEIEKGRVLGRFLDRMKHLPKYMYILFGLGVLVIAHLAFNILMDASSDSKTSSIKPDISANPAKSDGMVQDYEEALELFKEAAELNHAESQYMLGSMYENGEWVAQDKKKAVEFYQKAAEQGHAKAQYNLSVMYEKGQGGLKRNMKKAVQWYKKSAEQFYAQTLFNKAVEWYKKDAEQGIAPAQESVTPSWLPSWLKLGDE